MDRPATTRARAALPFALVALAFFALGLLAATLGSRERPDAPGPPGDGAPPAGTAAQGGGAPEPRILFDPSSIQLLPDASLELDLPPGFGGGDGRGGGSADGAGSR